MDFLASTTHFHILTWVAGIIIFIVTAGLESGTKGKKIAHMVTRLFYVLILLSGFMLFLEYSSMNAALYGVKFLLGLLTIGMMEMVLVRSAKNKSVKVFWILFFVFVLATLYLGFSMGIGFNFFAK